MKMKYKIALFVIGLLLAGHAYLGYSYALWVQNFEGKETNTIQSGCFTINFQELTRSINLRNTYPISDENALASVKPYQIRVENTCPTTDAGYAITLNTVNVTGTKLDDSKIKTAVGMDSVKPKAGSILSTMEINEELENIQVDNLMTSYIIETGFMKALSSHTFEIFLWIDANAGNEVMNQMFEASIVITSYATKIPETMNDFGIEESVVTSGDGIYKVDHPESEFTTELSNSLTDSQKSNLKKSEYRYAGSNPNNYVTFNNELWRIIGLVNTPEGQRLKLIRNESIGSYSWNSSDQYNNGAGSNEWSKSKMMPLLNQGAYYTRSSGECTIDSGNVTTPCDFTTNGLSPEAKKLIDTITWNTGSNGDNTEEEWRPYQMYNYERSNLNGKICSESNDCNDIDERTTTWQGRVGLIYPSDYGYATGNNDTIARSTCLETSLSAWGSTECMTNNWLSINEGYQWTITPAGEPTYARGVFFIHNTDKVVHHHGVFNTDAVKPTVYLKTNVKIISGIGTQENPYELL